jgi:glycosyltransferase involved in cell wall biosynthesis
MNIGIIFGDVANQAARAYREAKALSGFGHQVTLFCYNEKKQLEVTRKGSYTLHQIPFDARRGKWFAIDNTIPIFSLIWCRHIRRFIREYQLEVLFVHDLFMMRAAIWANRRHKLPVILNLHENYPAVVRDFTWSQRPILRMLSQPQKWEALERAHLTYASAIVNLTSSYNLHLQKKYPELMAEKFFLFPNVPDMQEMDAMPLGETAFPKGKEEFIVFYFGIIGKRRGMDICFEVWEKLSTDYPHIKLLLIGPVDKADQKEFFEQVAKPALQKTVLYKPWIDVSEIRAYAELSDVSICPLVKNEQHDSVIANKIFQFMYLGLPLLVSNCKPQQDIVEEEQCGLVFRHDAADELMEKVLFLYRHRDACKAMGQNGQKAVVLRYNTEVFNKNYESALEYALK